MQRISRRPDHFGVVKVFMLQKYRDLKGDRGAFEFERNANFLIAPGGRGRLNPRNTDVEFIHRAPGKHHRMVVGWACLNVALRSNHVHDEPGTWPGSEFGVWAALLLLATGLVATGLLITLILLRWRRRARRRRLLGFITHCIILFQNT
jgi:hypothetical protein